MTYFYKGEFVDNEPDINDGAYISKFNNLSFIIIVVNKEKGVYIIDDDRVYYDDYTVSCSNEYVPYFWILESFLSKHVEGITSFDRDTLEFIVNSIENTYGFYFEFRNHLLMKLDGGNNTKTARQIN